MQQQKRTRYVYSSKYGIMLTDEVNSQGCYSFVNAAAAYEYYTLTRASMYQYTGIYIGYEQKNPEYLMSRES